MRAAGGENGQCGFGAHAIDGGEQLIAALLLPGGEAVDVVSVLFDGLRNIELGGGVQFQLGSGIGGDAAAVAHAAAVDDGQTGLQYGHRAGNVV